MVGTGRGNKRRYQASDWRLFMWPSRTVREGGGGERTKAAKKYIYHRSRLYHIRVGSLISSSSSNHRHSALLLVWCCVSVCV